MPRSHKIWDRTVKRWLDLVGQSDKSPVISKTIGNHCSTSQMFFCFFFSFLSHGTWLTEPWLYSGSYLSSSTLQFRQSSMPLPVFPWQLLWQQPLLDQPPIRGVTLEWPLHGLVKRTHLDKEIQEGVIIMITEALITLNSPKKFSSSSVIVNEYNKDCWPNHKIPLMHMWGHW